MSRTAFLLMALTVPVTAQGQTSQCSDIRSDAARLACYDRIYPPKKGEPQKPLRNVQPNPTVDPNRVLGQR